MGRDGQRELSRREREIMNIVFGRGEATAAEVWEELSEQPSRTAVRTMLRILEDKGQLEHEKRGRQHVYRPTAPRERVGRKALRGVLHTFFDGSLEEAVAAHLADDRAKLSAEELDRLARLIDEARAAETGEGEEG